MGFALSGMQVRSSAFDSDGPIPTRHSGEGEDVSPALAWSDVPEGTRSLVVMCHDPDAPLVSGRGTYGFVHWVLYNVPGDVSALPEGVDAYTAGVNDMGNAAYNGPMPPNGHGTHRYYFWVMALKSQPKLEPGLSLWEVLERVEPEILGMNRLVGTYRRD